MWRHNRPPSQPQGQSPQPDTKNLDVFTFFSMERDTTKIGNLTEKRKYEQIYHDNKFCYYCYATAREPGLELETCLWMENEGSGT